MMQGISGIMYRVVVARQLPKRSEYVLAFAQEGA